MFTFDRVTDSLSIFYTVPLNGHDMEYDTDLITDVSLEEVKDDLVDDHFYESLSR